MDMVVIQSYILVSKDLSYVDLDLLYDKVRICF